MNSKSTAKHTTTTNIDWTIHKTFLDPGLPSELYNLKYILH